MKRLIYFCLTFTLTSNFAQEAPQLRPFPIARNAINGEEDIGLDLKNRAAQFEAGGIAGNPAVVNLVSGTGALFRRIGLDARSGMRIGGLYIGDANYLLTRGLFCRKFTGNSLLILSLSIQTQQFLNWPGGLFDVEFLQYNGQPTNAEAGVVQGFNNLPSLPPFNRSQLLQLWYRQAFNEERFVVRFGKTIVAQDFDNVVRPIPLRTDPLAREATSGLIYRPIFANPVTFGFIPGIYNAVYGFNTFYYPTKQSYAGIGLYDGNFARDFDLSIIANAPRQGPYRLIFMEIGASWHLGQDPKPGSFGIGAFAQTGLLTVPIVRNLMPIGRLEECGAQGFYLFGTQRLWFANPGIDSSGIVGLYQFGMNNSITRPITKYIGGAMTFYGLVPKRHRDSFGFGGALSFLNQQILPRKTEFMMQGYYQMNVWKTIFFVSALSYIPNPGLSATLSNVVAATARMIFLF